MSPGRLAFATAAKGSEDPSAHSIIAACWNLYGPRSLFKKGLWRKGPLGRLGFECFGLKSECDAIDVDQPFELIEVFLSTNDEVLVVPARFSALFVSNSCNFSVFSKLLLSAVGDELRGWRRVHQQTLATCCVYHSSFIFNTTQSE